MEDADVCEPVGVAAAVAVDDDEHEFEAALPLLAPRPLLALLGVVASEVFEPEAALEELACEAAHEAGSGCVDVGRL